MAVHNDDPTSLTAIVLFVELGYMSGLLPEAAHTVLNPEGQVPLGPGQGWGLGKWCGVLVTGARARIQDGASNTARVGVHGEGCGQG